MTSAMVSINREELCSRWKGSSKTPANCFLPWTRRALWMPGRLF